MPQFDPTTFASQLFWLALTFGALFAFLSVVALPRLEGVLRDRAAAIAADLKVAKEAQQSVEVMGARMRQSQLKARTDARGIVDGIRKEVGAVILSQKAELQQELLTQSEVAARHIASVRAKALADVEKAVLALVPIAAAHVVADLKVTNDSAAPVVAQVLRAA
jgi:F-type H+-transporting ATPase subunit b